MKTNSQTQTEDSVLEMTLHFTTFIELLLKDFSELMNITQYPQGDWEDFGLDKKMLFWSTGINVRNYILFTHNV